MPVATITSKGQITIPKAIRELLGVGPGDRLAFVYRGDGAITIEAETVDVHSLRGMVRYEGPPVSVETMNAVIIEAATT